MWKISAMLVIASGVMAGCAVDQHYPDLKKPALSGSPAPAASKQPFSLSRYTFQDWLDARKQLHWPDAQQQLPNPAFIITMSGGGPRAAALAYRTLESLNKVTSDCSDAAVAPADPKGCSLLDHVIMVTGISGGSFTASQFALHRKAMFDSTVFQDKIIKRNLKAEIGAMFVQPQYWPDRTQKVVDIFNDDALLAHHTYADLMKDPRAPYLLLAGSDIATGRTFAFEQDSFDDLCADVGKLEIARAVAAAGSFPYVLNGINLENYHATTGCGAAENNLVTPTDILASQAKNQPIGNGDSSDENPPPDAATAARARYRLWMRQATPDGWSNLPGYPEFRETPLDRQVKFVHLFDGGIADNLGLRRMAQYLSDPATLKEMYQNGAHAVVVIEINARSDASSKLSQSRQGPSWVSLTDDMASGAIDRVTELSSFALEDHLAVVFQAQGDTVAEQDRYPTVYVSKIDADLLPLRQDQTNIERDDGLRESFKSITTFQTLDSGYLKIINRLSDRLLEGTTCKILSEWKGSIKTGIKDATQYASLNRDGCSVFDNRFTLQRKSSVPQGHPVKGQVLQ